MKLNSKNDETVTFKMTHEQALMIVALIRETCFGTVMHDFETRVGHSPKEFEEIISQMGKILESIDVSE